MLTWEAIFQHWGAVQADLHSEYGIDLGDRELMRARSWPWLRTRIIGLAMADTRLARALSPQQ